jgi:hypothetical protein
MELVFKHIRAGNYLKGKKEECGGENRNGRR